MRPSEPPEQVSASPKARDVPLAEFRRAAGEEPVGKFVIAAVLGPPLHEGIDVARVVGVELLLDGASSPR